MGKLTVTVSSLLRLVLCITDDLDEFVIDTPSLEYLKLEYRTAKSHHFLTKKMPKLREAYLNVYFPFPYIERLIGSITSVKRLALCQLEYSTKGQDVYGDGFVFNQLEHLEICICEFASTVLVRLLKDSPNLLVLDLFGMKGHHPKGVSFWNQPSTVPECLSSSLQTFNLLGYRGRPKERDLVTYILQNTRCLKTATILSQSCMSEKLDMMIKELSLSPRASAACQLVFV